VLHLCSFNVKLTLTKVSLRIFPIGWTRNAPETKVLIHISFDCHFSFFHLIKAFFHSSSIIISIVGKFDDEWTRGDVGDVQFLYLLRSSRESSALRKRSALEYEGFEEDDDKLSKTRAAVRQHNLW
jgi:hypothetical protein